MVNRRSNKGTIIDIDAITGGYNFQAAWSGGFVAGKLGSE